MSILHKTYRQFTDFKCKRNKYSWTIISFYNERLLTYEKEDYKDEHNKINYNFRIKDYFLLGHYKKRLPNVALNYHFKIKK